MPNPPVRNRVSTTAARPSAFSIQPHVDLSPEAMFRQVIDTMSLLHDKMDNVMLRLRHIEMNIDSTQREVTHLRTAVQILSSQSNNQNSPSCSLPRRL